MQRGMGRIAALLVAGALAGGVVAAGAGASAAADTVTVSAGKDKRGPRPLRATIRRTKYGIPHIRSDSIQGVAAGFGYAYAADNICTIASEYVTVAGKRSKYFGPNASWTFSGNGTTYDNIDADTYFRWAIKQHYVKDLLNKPPPLGPKRGVRDGVRGYVAGYNAYLRDVGGSDGISDPACRGADWVRPIRPIDAYRRFFQLGILASSGAVIDGITDAAPQSPSTAAAADDEAAAMLESGRGLGGLQPDIGSNAYGLGSEATRNGRGLVLGNPHFPWDGSERLYQSHLTVPGKLDVEGASLGGVPLVLIGWTRGLAWSHTVATAWRFTPFKLTLPPGDPHSYVVDGQTRPMKATRVGIRMPDGSKRHDTIYSTEYGPMIDDLVGIPLPWTDGSGFALKDVNVSNFRYLNHFYENDQAQTVREYDRIERKYQGIPWVNSIAADSKGHAYYSMQGAIPYVSDELAARCNIAQAGFETLGLPILDGSRSDCDWQTAGDGVAPGTFPPGKVPTQFRDDYVHNGNDSHWLTNPEQPLTGFDRIIGIEDAERTYRTRIGLIQVQQRLAGTDGLPGKGFDRHVLQKVALGNRQYLGELWRNPLVRLCKTLPGGMALGSSGPVNVGAACGVLDRWNVRDDLGSNGAILFRRFASNLLGNFQALPTGLQGETVPGSETLYTHPYDDSDPVHTPSGLNVANPLVQRALADAVTDLQDAGIPLDAPLRGYQYDVRGGARIPIGGGPGGLGVFDAINVPWDPNKGYPDVPHGSSFIMAAQFKGGRCPVDAGTFVTYSESENQGSPHSSDYTRAFSRKRWYDAPFCRADVRRATRSTKRISVRRYGHP